MLGDMHRTIRRLSKRRPLRAKGVRSWLTDGIFHASDEEVWVHENCLGFVRHWPHSAVHSRRHSVLLGDRTVHEEAATVHCPQRRIQLATAVLAATQRAGHCVRRVLIAHAKLQRQPGKLMSFTQWEQTMVSREWLGEAN